MLIDGGAPLPLAQGQHGGLRVVPGSFHGDPRDPTLLPESREVRLPRGVVGPGAGIQEGDDGVPHDPVEPLPNISSSEIADASGKGRRQARPLLQDDERVVRLRLADAGIEGQHSASPRRTLAAHAEGEGRHCCGMCDKNGIPRSEKSTRGGTSRGKPGRHHQEDTKMTQDDTRPRPEGEGHAITAPPRGGTSPSLRLSSHTSSSQQSAA
eukprot:COSAG01_NODE_24095_length_790_cov_1.748191_1_plen_209_part_10